MNGKKNIAILGGGNLGKAIARGISEKSLADPGQIMITRRNLASLQSFEKDGFLLTKENTKAVNQSEIVFLCVQPKQLPGLLEEISDVITTNHLLVSVITGVSISEIQKHLTIKVPIIRAMPNTAIAIGESMTCLASENASDQLDFITNVFEALGKTLVIDEKMMQAATVLGASGIAFFMRYLRAATQGGIQMGFHPEEAQMIAVQTAKGAASLILSEGSHPEVEIDKVTTPRGCTIEGLNEMEHQGFSSSLIKGLMTSFNKINTISQ